MFWHLHWNGLTEGFENLHEYTHLLFHTTMRYCFIALAECHAAYPLWQSVYR